MVKSWQKSIGAMIKHKTRVRAFCGTCGGYFKVNLELLERAHGPWYSLVGKKGTCPAWECEGQCRFQTATPDGRFVTMPDR